MTDLSAYEPDRAISLYSYRVPVVPPRPGTMREIAALIAKKYELSLDELKGPTRERRVSWPRQEAFALIYAQGSLSLPQIGQFFGGRDHTTVLHGIRRHKARVAEEARIAAL